MKIKTEADDLMGLLETRRTITSGHAARILGVNKRQVEEWADFLEKKGKIKYR